MIFVLQILTIPRIRHPMDGCISLWNGHDATDVIWIFISLPDRLLYRAVQIGGPNYFVCNSWYFLCKNMFLNLIKHGYIIIKNHKFSTNHNRIIVLLRYLDLWSTLKWQVSSVGRWCVFSVSYEYERLSPHYEARALFQYPINSYPPSAAYMGQRIGSSLVKIMTCRLFGAKPLTKPMLSYC